MKWIKDIFFSERIYYLLSGIAVVFVFGNFFPILFTIAKFSLLGVACFTLIDLLFLFISRSTIKAQRRIPSRLSNGDDNEVKLYVTGNYPVTIFLTLYEELPFQFQNRDFRSDFSLSPHAEKEIIYHLTPLERGNYQFGNTIVYISSFIGLVKRRFICNTAADIPVYPSFVQMKKYEFLAINNRMEEAGIIKVRKKGVHSEFDQLREYVIGDDYRSMNWKATARKGSLIVNQYQDEKAKDIYFVIDKGRTMKMPFEGLSLLDYAINASLVMSNIALMKQDKVGIITYQTEIDSFIASDRKSGQLNTIMEVLYNQQTSYKESNSEMLYLTLKKKVHQRSLIILFSNYESVVSVRRFIPPLRNLSRQHLVLMIVFENTEVKQLINYDKNELGDFYQQVIAEKFIFEKKLIVKELQRNGVHAILTSPQNLTVKLINKYLEFKAQEMI